MSAHASQDCAVLNQAADLLDAQADFLWRSHKGPTGDWDEHANYAEFKQHKSVAAKLRKLARQKGQSASARNGAPGN
jgi:hypothetical protein